MVSAAWVWLTLFGLPDSSRPGVWRWISTEVQANKICGRISVKTIEWPAFVILQESVAVETWREVRRVFIDRWTLPKEYSLCWNGGQIGKKVRFVITLSTRPKPSYFVLWEGYPWGRIPLPPVIHFRETKPPALHLDFPDPGQYVMRCYNRFGEEVFTIPFDLTHPTQFDYMLPPQMRGNYLIQVYSLELKRVVAEKGIRL